MGELTILSLDVTPDLCELAKPIVVDISYRIAHLPKSGATWKLQIIFDATHAKQTLGEHLSLKLHSRSSSSSSKQHISIHVWFHEQTLPRHPSQDPKGQTWRCS